MPVAHINLLKGYPRETLRQIIVEVTDAMSRILGAPKDRLMVWISEHDHHLWCLGGVPAEEALAKGERRALETPFVQMVLMDGRPAQQFHDAMAAVTDIIARATGVEQSHIRVHIAAANPDYWGIGGVPASVSRAGELAARAKGTASLAEAG